jgi:hypothetical protein
MGFSVSIKMKNKKTLQTRFSTVAVPCASLLLFFCCVTKQQVAGLGIYFVLQRFGALDFLSFFFTFHFCFVPLPVSQHLNKSREENRKNLLPATVVMLWYTIESDPGA